MGQGRMVEELTNFLLRRRKLREPHLRSQKKLPIKEFMQSACLPSDWTTLSPVISEA
jgi:hypothetical protein